MQFTVNIGSNILGGAVAGAATAAVVIAVFALMGAAVESLMSLGGSGGFLEKPVRGCLIYVPAGMIIGGVAATGLPWWSAIPAVFLVLFLLSLVMYVRQRVRGY